jgi:hypothetical protein
VEWSDWVPLVLCIIPIIDPSNIIDIVGSYLHLAGLSDLVPLLVQHVVAC